MSSTLPSFAPRRQSPLPLLFAGAAFGLAAWLVLDRTGVFDPSITASPRPVTPRGELAPIEQNFIDVFERVSRSVAHINTSSRVRTSWGRVQRKDGTGSGFVWDRSGVVVTNEHVVRGAREVYVTVDGRNFRADVLNTSPEHDLAVLKLRGKTRDLQPIDIGSSSDLRVGQTAIAIGNPFAFDLTMTTGIVSALYRTLCDEDGRLMHDLIQVDAAINPGNSGGPLLDSAGRLIGVTTAIYSPSGANAGLGFAVPADTVNRIVPWMLGQKSDKALLGVRRGDYGSYTLPPELGYASGAIFEGVVEGSGANDVGLKPFRVENGPGGAEIIDYGDVIVQIDAHLVRSFSDLGTVLDKHAPGDTVELTVIRGLPDRPRRVKLRVKLGAQHDPGTTGM